MTNASNNSGGALIAVDMNQDGDRDIVAFGAGQALFQYNNQNQFDNPSMQILGTTFWDLNENGTQDAGEPLVEDVKIQVTSDEFSLQSQHGGNFQLNLPPDTYSLTYLAKPCWTLTTDSVSYTIDSNSPMGTDYVFGFSSTETNTDAASTIMTGITRCNTQIPAWITIENTACKILETGSYRLILSPLTTFENATPYPDEISGDTLWWNLPVIDPGKKTAINLVLTVAGPEFIEETIRLEGNTYVEASPNNPYLLHETSFESLLICAYDPNDKLVTPSRGYEKNYTFPDETLEYTVRFQNTGNDTAFLVRIIDHLHPDLDWNTFERIAASHPNVVELNLETGKVEVVFDDILLPDSTTNYEASNGFVSFRIQARSDIPEFTPVFNSAGIFFDLNPPILTNTVQNTFVESFTCEKQIGPEGQALEPFILMQEQEDLECYGDSIAWAQVLIEGGLMPYNFQWSNGDTETQAENLMAGFYYVLIQDDGNCSDSLTFEIEQPEELTLLANIEDATDDSTADGSIVIDEIEGGTYPYLLFWSDGETGYTREDLLPGVYELTIVDANDCETFHTFTVNDLTSTSSTSRSLSVTVFPNPSTAGFALEWSQARAGLVQLEIRHGNGQAIYSIEQYVNAGVQKLVIPEHVFSATGWYWMSLTTEEGYWKEGVMKIQK
jgi:uncharacterized repeat protein (TIGR01451 family)